jgi:hypothetical protein
MDWFWPTLDNDHTIAARFGHILFWIGAGIAGLFAIGMFWTAVMGGEDRVPGILICGGFAAFFYLIGRGLCYIFSGD